MVDLEYLRKTKNPFKMGYDPKLNFSPELDPDAVYFHQIIIGILRQMIEFRRIDIITKVLLLTSHLALPREGHLDAAVHIMTHIVRDMIPDWCMILHDQK